MLSPLYDPALLRPPRLDQRASPRRARRRSAGPLSLFRLLGRRGVTLLILFYGAIAALLGLVLSVAG